MNTNKRWSQEEDQKLFEYVLKHSEYLHVSFADIGCINF